MPIGSIVGGLIGSSGAQAAGNAAGAGGQAAYQAALEQGALARAAVSPWTNTGRAAESELASLYGLGTLKAYPDGRNSWELDQSDRAGNQKDALSRFTTSPGYTFRLQQGVNAMDRSAAARGMLLSGAQKKGVSDYGQNTASAEYGNYVSGLSGLAGGGLTGATGANTVSGSLASTGINALSAGNTARASSYSSAANALGSGIGKGVQNALAIGAYGNAMNWFE